MPETQEALTNGEADVAPLIEAPEKDPMERAGCKILVSLLTLRRSCEI